MASSSNLLLRRLSPADQALLEPFAETVTVQRGARLFSPADRLSDFYFPESAIFSLEEQVGQSRHIEVAVIGREGLLGWPALLGSDVMTHAVVAQLRAGSTLRIAVEPLRRHCGVRVLDALLQFVHLIIVQMGRSIASHLHDTVNKRIARWLLMRHDRLGGDVLLVQHDEIAANLSVRRASITDGLHMLEGELLIRCNRGRILIRDRSALEERAGDAYGEAEAQYRNLIAPFGKSAGCRLIAA
ncbi:Crp/Fnr family transcriptional regulator [Sphingomonas nostoxanthinifaciens]|uniref:Crp/Fnr family transcriptional regulator n=1 Tax=Sphingomonas nostoxanthinifaciens TaxID=2872652 RepID=UPI001CC1DE66|nr:Crp/Fnr family transcriptional regulator [Sphingomonas nostoxanthinifaciens]UAK23172.1 Crp/Fnr family transcriptional regulator [Sphingomonas nostoxanthinifaciens]